MNRDDIQWLQSIGAKSARFSENGDLFDVEFFSPSERMALELPKLLAESNAKQGAKFNDAAAPTSPQIEAVRAKIARASETGEPEELRKLQEELAHAERDALLYGHSE